MVVVQMVMEIVTVLVMMMVMRYCHSHLESWLLKQAHSSCWNVHTGWLSEPTDQHNYTRPLLSVAKIVAT